jgi:uncharacterized protein
MSDSTPSAAIGLPIDRDERIVSLDVLRGFALLGILIMNIQSFSMPGAAYLNPTAYGDLTGINLWVWITSHILADQKFMSLFSMLFGVGVIIFAERAAAKQARAGWLHYRRSFWLLVFGLAHAHLLWYGDILYSYAICALWVYLFRNCRPLTLVIWGFAFISVAWAYNLVMGNSLQHFPPEALESIRQAWIPIQVELAAATDAHNGGYAGYLAYNSSEAMFMETMVFLTMFLWRVTGMMLVGMALYRWGVLDASRSWSFYRRLAGSGAVIGLSLIGVGLSRNFDHGFSMEYSFFLGSQWNYWGSIGLSLTYVALIMMMVKGGYLRALQSRLAAVGRMAFTNYLMQTVIGVVLFGGLGLGVFGSIERWAQILVVLAIWALQLLVSPMWLARFKFGPMEWLWRSLTYWQRQPMSLR